MYPPPRHHSRSLSPYKTDSALGGQVPDAGSQRSRCSDKSSVRIQQFVFDTPRSTSAAIPSDVKTPIPYNGKRNRLHPMQVEKRRRELIGAMDGTFSNCFPEYAFETSCEYCQRSVLTRIRYRVGTYTWLAAFVLLVLTVIFFWVPFYVKYFKDIVHHCPACSREIGRFRRA